MGIVKFPRHGCEQLLGHLLGRSNEAISEGFVAGGPGFEPGLTESESAVLPLNYPPPRSPQKALKSKDFGMPERSLGPVDILLFEADSPLLRNLIQG